MFFTCEANVPVSAFASRELFGGAIETLPPSAVTATDGCTRFVSVPFEPFTVKMPFATDTSVLPAGVGFFASRLIVLPDFEKILATDLRLARLGV